MAFDIDKMKADGVSSHLIELAQLGSQEQSDVGMLPVFEKIVMGIENTQIFRDFVSMSQDAPVWDYMYVAGLCTRYEADWFKSEENPYIDTITLTQTSEGVIYYYTEQDGEPKNFEGTLVIPKGTTLYFPATGLGTIINDESLESGKDMSRIPYEFNEDATIHQEPQE